MIPPNRANVPSKLPAQTQRSPGQRSQPPAGTMLTP